MNGTRQQLLNVPNLFTAARLVLAIVAFVFVGVGWYLTALVVFSLAAATDWFDGYLARRYHQVTKVGRMFDPFVDKILICGLFIFLAVEPHSGIRAWMAVVVMSRELLITGLRTAIEAGGIDFSALWAGKWKMLFQCVAGGASLLALHFAPAERPLWVQWVLPITVWLAVLSTIVSGVLYLRVAARAFRG